MFNDPPIAFREFAIAENLPLATIHGVVLEFLRGRVDAAIFGAQAVNAYVDNSRMTQAVDKRIQVLDPVDFIRETESAEE